MTIAYALIIILLALTIDETSAPNEVAFMILLCVIVTISLIRICYKKGEKPERRWGKKKQH